MTRDQIIEVVRGNLSQDGLDFFTLLDFTDSIQDGYNLAVGYSECIEGYGTIDFVSELTYYDFSTLLTNYLRPLAIFNNNTNRWLEATSLKELQKIDYKWETVHGEPIMFWPINFKYVALFPRPSTATGNMTIFYKKVADTLTGGTTPEIPDECVDVLEQYVTSDMLDQLEEYNKSTRYFKEMQETLEGLKKLVNKRLLPDIILRLRDQNDLD